MFPIHRLAIDGNGKALVAAPAHAHLEDLEGVEKFPDGFFGLIFGDDGDEAGVAGLLLGDEVGLGMVGVASVEN